MQLNILTRTQGEQAAKKYDIALDDFWKLYFRMLGIIGITINPREEDVLSYILSHPQGVDYFTGEGGKQMKKDLKLAASEVTRFKQALRAKRLINDHDNQPVQEFMNLYKFVTTNREVTFLFPLKIIG